MVEIFLPSGQGKGVNSGVNRPYPTAKLLSFVQSLL